MNIVNKLQAMEEMSRRISDKCADYKKCYDCQLYKHKHDAKKGEGWCGDYKDIDDYQEIVHKCMIMGIDISDINVKHDVDKHSLTEFTVDDIKSGYLLRVRNIATKEEVICIGIQNQDIVNFYEMKIACLYKKIFNTNDITKDFDIKSSEYCIISVHGYIEDDDCFNLVTTKKRPLLWSREDKTYQTNYEE